jgi:undecaprenyl diphosphate synthase
MRTERKIVLSLPVRGELVEPYRTVKMIRMKKNILLAAYMFNVCMHGMEIISPKEKKQKDSTMLKHLACIMDGNRRWARNHKFEIFLGHKKGLEAVQQVIDFCLTKKISYLSLYTFSIENLEKRSSKEQDYLFDVLAKEALQDLDTFKNKNVRIKFVGNRTLFPLSMKSVCEKAEQETEFGTALQVNFLLCYGGRQEIADAAKRIALEVAQGTLQPESITSDVFEKFLWTAPIPSPDLIIRTGGEHRLSNFLLFQCAYSELYFTDTLWPDISSIELEAALTSFDTCRKNFGR